MTIRCQAACVLATMLALASSACLDAAPPPAAGLPDGGSLPELDEWDVLARVAGQAYTGEGFVAVNAKPYHSDLAGTDINVYVSTDGWWEFLHARPEATGHGVTLPVGTLIVREVLDANGEVETLTVMQRGPEGYSPAHGDIWYAVLEPDGFPRFENGEPLIGRLEERCTGCHDDRADDGHLFGVPVNARRPSLPVPGSRNGPRAAR